MINEDNLRKKLIEYFESQGFKYNPHVRPPTHDKETYKKLQQQSRLEQIELRKNSLKKSFKKAKNYLRDGRDIIPEKISLKLIEVRPKSMEADLFHWWNLIWWSVPYQRGYGRLLRYLLWDETHDALFGLVSLQSPILKMSVRDDYLKLPKDELDIWVNQSLQAQRLGALPPYNQLLGSKMCALTVACNEVRQRYSEKYEDVATVIKNRKLNNRLLFVTTTSAFGRSSVYNRLKYNNEKVAYSLGYTKGSGSFHISEKLYLEIIQFLTEKGFEIGRGYGNGPSRKMRLVNKGLNLLGLKDAVYHNIPREFFYFPLVENLTQVVHQDEEPIFYDRSFSDLFSFWHKRYALPRATRDESWKEFKAESFLSELAENYDL